MLAISTFVSGKSSYKRCIVNNMVLDANGKKMSKRLGNVYDPKRLFSVYGADIVRWYLLSWSQVWLPKKFDEDALIDVMRKFFSTLQNSYSFFALYAELDKFDPGSEAPSKMPLIDTWLLSRLNGLIKGCAEAYENFEFTRATRLLSNFVIDELSNWWIKRSRKRFWGTEMSDDKRAAYHVLYQSLLAVAKMIAPVAPFTAEDIFRRLTESFDGYPESVHHCEFPKADDSKIIKDLDYAMSMAEEIVKLGRAARKDANIKVRQPLPKIFVINESGKPPSGLDPLVQVILEELNVKAIEFTSEEQKFIGLSAQPQFKLLGPKFGKLAPKVADAAKALDSRQIADLQQNGSIKIKVDDFEKTLTLDEVLIKVMPKEGYTAASDGKLKVALDLQLDDRLIAEGFARELVNKIQNMRKTGGLEVTDRIQLGISSSTEISRAIELFGDYIKNETLAVSLDDNTDRKIKKEWDINGIDTVISLEKN
jgi:isoleucyl-tRNA synthetase